MRACSIARIVQMICTEVKWAFGSWMFESFEGLHVLVLPPCISCCDRGMIPNRKKNLRCRQRWGNCYCRSVKNESLTEQPQSYSAVRISTISARDAG